MTNGKSPTVGSEWAIFFLFFARRMTKYDQTTLHTGGRKQNGVVVHFLIVPLTLIFRAKSLVTKIYDCVFCFDFCYFLF